MRSKSETTDLDELACLWVELSPKFRVAILELVRNAARCKP
jgi:hypothetical protein